MENYLNRYYNIIIKNVKLLALDSYEDQKADIEGFADAPFEILDGYQNAFLLLAELVENNFFSNNEISALIKLYYSVAFLLSDDDFFSMKEEDLLVSKKWNEIKVNAKKVLLEFSNLNKI